MIKTILTVTAATGLVIAGPAFAATTPAVSDSGTVNISGSVGKKCHFMSDNATPDPIDLGELADSSTGALDGAKVNGKTATINAWCNNAAQLTVRANPIATTTNTAPSTDFDDRVDYTATATFASVTASDSSVGAASDGSPASTGIFSDTITVTLSSPSTPNSGLLVAGDYSGTVVLTLTPQ